MVNAKELRIGNYVYYLGTPVKIESGAQIDKNFKSINPITLTPEIFERCGFKECFIHDAQQDYRGDYFVKNNFKLYRDPGEECYYFRYGDTELYPADKHEIEIKFLHQLQNLYFDLIGEELELKTVENLVIQ